MNERGANWFILITIFILWLYNTGRLRAIRNVISGTDETGQAVTYVKPVQSVPAPKPPPKQESGGGGGGGFFNQLLDAYLATQGAP